MKFSLAAHPDSRVLVLAPHPDDESLAVGGLLQKILDAGGRCRVIFLTNGENNPWPQRVIERRWRIGPIDKERWGKRRRLEAISALAELGIPETAISFLGFPDQGLTDLLLSANNEISERLAEHLDEWQPSLLVSPSATDLHPDHSAASVFVRLALARRKVRSVDLLHLEYRIHTRQPEHKHDSFDFTLTEIQREQKRRAILRHTSQLVLRRNLVNFAQDRERFFSSKEIRNLRQHPLQNATAANGEITLDLKLSSNLGAFGKAILYLVSSRNGHIVQVLSLLLSQRRFELCDVRNVLSEDVVASAHIRQSGSCHIVRIPKALISSADFIFAKVGRRFGFFDAAGWCEISKELKSTGT
jgi:LmbE family N-acetylglucosaminyl deacetylase